MTPINAPDTITAQGSCIKYNFMEVAVVPVLNGCIFLIWGVYYNYQRSV